MKFLIALVSMLFVSSLSFAEVITCRFSELRPDDSSSVALLKNCQNGQRLELIGTNNSPCKANDALRTFFAKTEIGDLVTLDVRLFRHSTLGGMDEDFEVVSGRQANQAEVKAPNRCSSTHIQVLSN